MTNCEVRKVGKKWAVYLEDGTAVFTGRTRVSCFRYANENGLKITAYQHG